MADQFYTAAKRMAARLSILKDNLDPDNPNQSDPMANISDAFGLDTAAPRQKGKQWSQGEDPFIDEMGRGTMLPLDAENAQRPDKMERMREDYPEIHNPDDELPYDDYPHEDIWDPRFHEAAKRFAAKLSILKDELRPIDQDRYPNSPEAVTKPHWMNEPAARSENTESPGKFLPPKKWYAEDLPGADIDDPYNLDPEDEEAYERDKYETAPKNYDIQQQNIAPDKMKKFRDPKEPLPYEFLGHNVHEAAKRAVQNREFFSQLPLDHNDPQIHKDMKDWAQDCNFEGDPDFDTMSPDELRKGIDYHYDGGFPQFMADGNYNKHDKWNEKPQFGGASGDE